MMFDRCDFNEHESERSKNHRLNQTNEHFQEHKWQWRAIGHEVRNDDKQHLAGKNIAE